MRKSLFILSWLFAFNVQAATLLQFAGFEGGGSQTEGQIGSNGSPVYNYAVQKRTGKYSLQLGSGATRVRHGEINTTTGSSQVFSGAAQSQLYIFVAFYVETAAADELISLDQGGGACGLALRLTAGNQIAVYGGGANICNTSIATGATVLNTGQWYILELFVNRSTDTYELQINDTVELSGTTEQHASAYQSVNLGKTNTSSTAVFLYDDFAVASDAWPGNIQVKQALPRADGTPAQWTNGTAPSNYTQVDEEGPNSADYIASFATGNQTNYVLLESAATVGVTGTIRAVKAYTQIREAAFQNTATTLRIRTTANSDNSAADAVGSTLNRFRVANVDPNGVAWLASVFDTVQIGLIEANLVNTRGHWLGAMVAYDSTTPEPSGPGHKAYLLQGVG